MRLCFSSEDMASGLLLHTDDPALPSWSSWRRISQQSPRPRRLVRDAPLYQLVAAGNDLRHFCAWAASTSLWPKTLWEPDVQRRSWNYFRRRHLDLCAFLSHQWTLIDKKIGGKNGILIAALGASAANVALGVLTWLIIVRHLKVNFALAYLAALFGEHVFSKLRRDVHHQGQGLLVSRARTRHLWRDFWHAHFVRRLFCVRLGRRYRLDDQSHCFRHR